MVVIKLIPSVLQAIIPIGGRRAFVFVCDELPRVQKVVQSAKKECIKNCSVYRAVIYLCVSSSAVKDEIAG